MEFIFVIAILVMSVVIHEVAHGFAALSLGDTTAKYQGRLTLNPLAHIDPVGSVLVPLMGYLLGGFVVGWAKPVPFNPYNLRSAKWGEAIVAGAGPLSNIAIAIVFSVIIRVVVAKALIGQAALELLSFVVIINLTLALFNLLPVPPLDGSKILFAVIPGRWANIRFALERLGIVLVLIFVFALWPFIAPLIYKLFTILTGLAF